MTHELKAVIFDSDGTLLDTREFICQCYEGTLRAHGHPVPDRAALTAQVKKGQPITESYVTLAPGGDLQTLINHHREFQLTITDIVSGYEGLHELLKNVRELGLKIAICTSRGKQTEALLEQVGIRNDIDALVTADDVTHHKPHPEPLLKALEQLGCEAAHAVMIGDTVADIGAGKAAGVAMTIGITHGFSDESILREAGADEIVHHLNDILPILKKFSLPIS